MNLKLKKLVTQLALVLMLPCFALTASAQWDGEGTQANPYQIKTRDDLQMLANKINYPQTYYDVLWGYYNTHFKLMNDLDLSDSPWVPIGTDSTHPFRGIFDGGNHVISSLEVKNSKLGGLFGYVAAADISNLGLENVNIDSVYSGGLVACATSSCYLTNCYVTGDISGESYAGGLIGYVDDWSGKGAISLTHCYAACTGNSKLKGLLGITFFHTEVIHCYYNKELCANADNGVGVGMTTAEMKTASFVAKLNDQWIKTQWQQADNDYPKLTLNPEIPTPWDGAGTSDDPFKIDTVDKLNAVSQYVNARYSKPTDHFKLMANLVLPGDKNPWTPIGLNELRPFTGTFDGGGKTISNLYVDAEYAGLFGYIEEGSVLNLGVINATVAQGEAEYGYSGVLVGMCYSGNDTPLLDNCYTSGTLVRANNYIGGLAGYCCGSITNCHSSATVTEMSDDGECAGGLIGYCYTETPTQIIKNCYATGAVSSTYTAGGLIGYSEWATISHCYATGAVSSVYHAGGLIGSYGGDVSHCYATGAVSSTYTAGGLIGESYSFVSNCYATGMVTLTSIEDPEVYGGGLIGIAGGTLSHCYSRGSITLLGTRNEYSVLGGLIGYNDCDNITHGYYNKETCKCPDNESGIGLTTSEMKTQGFVAKLNDQWVNTTWKFVPGDYPVLNPNPAPPAIPWAGDGTESSPYQIQNRKDLENLAAYINFGQTQENEYFQLQNDIDMEGRAQGSFTPIGNDINDFHAHFDGNNKIISNLYINLPGQNYVGLFGFVNNGTISNLGLTNVDIKGYGDVGALMGVNNSSFVKNCYVTGRVNGYYDVGGFCAINAGGVITYSYAIGEVSGNNRVAGFVAQNLISKRGVHGDVSNCYVASDVFVADLNNRNNRNAFFYIDSAFSQNCYYDQWKCFEESTATPCTTQMMKSEDFVAELNNGGDAFKDALNNYPVLKGQTLNTVTLTNGTFDGITPPVGETEVSAAYAPGMKGIICGVPPSENMKFLQWRGDISLLDSHLSDSHTSFTMGNTPLSFTAQYINPDEPWYLVNAPKNSETNYYELNDFVTITAPEEPNGKFMYWEAEGLDITDSKYLNAFVFSMPQNNVTLTPHYIYSHNLKLIIDNVPNPVKTYYAGDFVTVTAPEIKEKSFKGWAATNLDIADSKMLMEFSFTMPDKDVLLSANYLDNQTPPVGPVDPKTKSWIWAHYEKDTPEGITIDCLRLGDGVKSANLYRLAFDNVKEKKVGTFKQGKATYIIDADPNLVLNKEYTYELRVKKDPTAKDSAIFSVKIDTEFSFAGEIVAIGAGSNVLVGDSTLKFDRNPSVKGWYTDTFGKKPKTKKISYKLTEKVSGSVDTVKVYTTASVPMFNSKDFKKRTDSAGAWIVDNQDEIAVSYYAKNVNKALKYKKDYHTNLCDTFIAPQIDTILLNKVVCYVPDSKVLTLKGTGEDYKLIFEGSACGYSTPKAFIEYKDGGKFKQAKLKVSAVMEKDTTTKSKFVNKDGVSKFQVTIPAKKWTKKPLTDPTCLVISTGKGMTAIPVIIQK